MSVGSDNLMMVVAVVVPSQDPHSTTTTNQGSSSKAGNSKGGNAAATTPAAECADKSTTTAIATPLHCICQKKMQQNAAGPALISSCFQKTPLCQKAGVHIVLTRRGSAPLAWSWCDMLAAYEGASGAVSMGGEEVERKQPESLPAHDVVRYRRSDTVSYECCSRNTKCCSDCSDCPYDSGGWWYHATAQGLSHRHLLSPQPTHNVRRLHNQRTQNQVGYTHTHTTYPHTQHTYTYTHTERVLRTNTVHTVKKRKVA